MGDVIVVVVGSASVVATKPGPVDDEGTRE